jgi:hypothetical protein
MSRQYNHFLSLENRAFLGQYGLLFFDSGNGFKAVRTDKRPEYQHVFIREVDERNRIEHQTLIFDAS